MSAVAQRLRWLLWASLAWLAACVPHALLPSSYTFTAEAMQRALDKSFPVEKQYAGLLDLTLSQPKVGLRPTEQRVVLHCQTSLALFAYDRMLNGEVQISSRLTYDVARHAVVLQHPKLEQETLNNVPSALIPVLQNISAILVEKKLDGAVVYAFAPNQWQVLGTSLVPDHIDITPDGVVLHVKPAS